MGATKSENSTNDDKSILEKARDKIHEKVATDEQLFNEKPKPNQIRAKIPADQHEMAVKIDDTIDSVKQRFNERLDEGTEREQQRKQKEQSNTGTGPVGNIKNKLYEATKPPEVKEREQFREAPVTEKLSKLASGETNESVLETFASNPK